MDKIAALIRKEFFQMMRDPSSIIIAFVLPFMLLILYMYAINLDTVKVSLGLKIEDGNFEMSRLAEAFSQSKYVKATVYQDRETMYNDLIRNKIRGIVVIPSDFSTKLERGQAADMQVITDGSEVNLSNYAKSYPAMIANQWLSTSKYKYKMTPPLISPEIRYWYNQDINSHYFILPGSMAITMTLIGMLLTALVIAREWERGTMEALITTRVSKLDILLSKYIPYFTLGMVSMAFNVFMCVAVFHIPFRGSYLILFGVSALFLFTSLGFGLLISTNFKDQFLASQTALAVGFLPALMLSGLMFPISSMPVPIQWITMVLPARYYVSFIQSEFMAGTVWHIVIINSVYLLVLGVILFIAIYKKTKLRLD